MNLVLAQTREKIIDVVVSKKLEGGYFKTSKDEYYLFYFHHQYPQLGRIYTELKFQKIILHNTKASLSCIYRRSERLLDGILKEKKKIDIEETFNNSPVCGMERTYQLDELFQEFFQELNRLMRIELFKKNLEV